MLPLYTLKIDIKATDSCVDGELFRSVVGPSLKHLDSLKGAFDRKPSTVAYCSPTDKNNTSGCWSAHAVVMISIGKKRSEFLIQLYRSIVTLIDYELPDELEMTAEINEFQFS